MKKFNLTKSLGLAVILFAMISLFSLKTFAQCQANFTWTQTSNNVIAFTDASTNTSMFTIYQYNFGDGNNGYGPNLSHTYTAPGTYYVCLTISDSNQTCTSTFCDSVVVTGTIICNRSNCNICRNRSIPCIGCSKGRDATRATNCETN